MGAAYVQDAMALHPGEEPRRLVTASMVGDGVGIWRFPNGVPPVIGYPHGRGKPHICGFGGEGVSQFCLEMSPVGPMTWVTSL